MPAPLLRVLGLLIAWAAALALAGCGLGHGASDRVQDLADRVLPGQLQVIGQRSQPGTLGFPTTEVQLRIVGEPDAVVAVPSAVDEAGLRSAVTGARTHAEAFRRLRTALADRQLPIGAVAAGGSADDQQLYLELALTDANAIDVVARLDAAIATGWSSPGRLVLTLVDPGRVGPLPADDEALPTLHRWSRPDRVDAYRRAATHTATVAASGGRPLSVWASLRPVQSTAEAESIAAALRTDADRWLAGRGAGRVTGPPWWDWARLERGSLRELRVYLPACRSAVACTPAGTDTLVALSYDLLDGSVRERTTVTSDHGWLRLLEPERVDG